ncbi:MAG: hypothetical protein KIT58_06795 [Planctomycetota bacterium]|nr:hypothetical protein [Planctomycetota bacterium]
MHLLENGFTSSAEEKPARPKEAFESVLRATNTVRSAAIYKKLAAKASLRPRGCGSPSYGRFLELLHRWFVA